MPLLDDLFERIGGQPTAEALSRAISEGKRAVRAFALELDDARPPEAISSTLSSNYQRGSARHRAAQAALMFWHRKGRLSDVALNDTPVAADVIPASSAIFVTFNNFILYLAAHNRYDVGDSIFWV